MSGDPIVPRTDGTGLPFPEIDADDFARRFSVRADRLMWLLGAGTSASAGIPTAGDMIWEFKQELFISQRHETRAVVADLSNAEVRRRLQSHIDSSTRFPAAGSPEEYAALFEAVFAVESDRRAYLDAKLSGAKPSYGHLALATLMRAGLCRLVWTTNFDPLIADACAKVYETTGQLTTVALDAPDLAREAIDAERWPIEVKLHGDFRSRRLKNTGEELRSQDSQLRQVLVDSCRRSGLVVAGYSGRDESVMKALEDATAADGAFPTGLFWLHRGHGTPQPRVGELLATASKRGIETGLVRIENFDEALRDLVRQTKNLDTAVLEAFADERRHASGAPRPGGSGGWPVVRLNAIPVTEAPTVCRRVVCEIGGFAEVREAVERAEVDLIFARVRAGVLAFGADADVRTCLGDRQIKKFDLHTIEMKRLRYDSGERGLLRDALARALARERGLHLIRQRHTDLLSPEDPTLDIWRPLAKLVGDLEGTVAGHADLRWSEGLGTRLDFADDRLWLLIEPRIVFDGVTEKNRAAAADFGMRRVAMRYNRQLNELIAFWSRLIAGDGVEVRSLGVADGVEATFRLGRETAFSRRAHA